MSDTEVVNDKILRALERDGRMSNLALAAQVGLSPSACLRRVQELERRGAITGYRAVISQEARDVGFVAYVAVGLSRHHTSVMRDFERACEGVSAVRECHNITGSVEYLLRIEVRDLAAYKQFHREVLGEFSHVASISTYVVVGSPKDLRS